MPLALFDSAQLERTFAPSRACSRPRKLVAALVFGKLLTGLTPTGALATPDAPSRSTTDATSQRDHRAAVTALLVAAHERALRGEHLEALAMLRRASAVAPSPALSLLCAETELALARPRHALADFARLDLSRPELIELHALAETLATEVDAARAATTSQDFDDALSHWRATLELIEAKPLVPVSRYLIAAGHAATRAGRPEVARELIGRALEPSVTKTLSDREQAEARDALAHLELMTSKDKPDPIPPNPDDSEIDHLTPWILAGGSLLTLGGGIAMLVVAGDQRQEVRDAMRDGQFGVGLTRKEALELEDSANTLTVLGYSSLVVGLGLGIASVVFATDEPTTHTNIDGVSLQLGPHHVGIRAGGVF